MNNNNSEYIQLFTWRVTKKTVLSLGIRRYSMTIFAAAWIMNAASNFSLKNGNKAVKVA